MRKLYTYYRKAVCIPLAACAMAFLFIAYLLTPKHIGQTFGQWVDETGYWMENVK